MSAESLLRAADRAQAKAQAKGALLTPEGCALMAEIFLHAAALAFESEYTARRISDEAMTNIKPVYPPLVQMLIRAAALSDDSAAKVGEIRVGEDS